MPPSPNVRPVPTGRKAVVTIGFLGLLSFAAVRSRVHSAAGPEAVDLERAARRGFAFQDVTEESGVAFRHRPTRVDPVLEPIEAQITATGASVAVVDVDSDGDPDIYATTSRHGEANALYLNDGEGNFVDVAEEAGLADLNRDGIGCSMGSVWADVDRDGDQDVLVHKWGRQQLFLQTEPLRFVDATEAAGLGDLWMNCHDALFFDANRDGLVDLFLGAYFREELDLWELETTRIMQESFEFAHNGGRNRLLLNRGDARFEDVSDEYGIGGDRWTYASVAADFDHDGWLDLYVANDYGSEELLLNRGGERFEPADVDLDRRSKSGMCAALGDYGNHGRISVFVANISQPGYLFQGNNLRENRLPEGGGLVDGPSGPVRNCGWAWGASFGDLDLDGWQDLVVVNGFVSADPDRDYWYDMGKVAGGNGAFFEDALNWPPFEGRSLSGFERTRVLHNRNGRTFVEIGRDVGPTDTLDGRAVVLSDLDGDGRLDMVVANQDGPLLIYRNVGLTDEPRHWVAFDLVGTASDPDAAGAAITVEFGEHRQTHVSSRGGGFSSQGDARLHFGLGEHDGVDSVIVRWPSGLVEDFGPYPAGAVHRLVERSADDRR